MYSSLALSAIAEDGPSLPEVQETISVLASGLDERFVRAGTALATAFEIIEKLVASLDGVTNALDRDAADSAVNNMRMTANRLSQLPMLQAQRQGDLAAIQSASVALREHIAKIYRTLSFLQICGLNIRIAAGGAVGFSGFADHMSERLDFAEQQLAGFEAEIRQLGGEVTHMAEADKVLAVECIKIIPHVPEKLSEDAAALQRHQAEIATLASQIADVAREIRAKVASALGALQIGDITRQRLEHVSDGIGSLRALHAESADADAAVIEAVAGRTLALLAAQAADTIDDFQREARVLTQSLRGIVPDTGRLLELRDSGAAGQGADGQSFLLELERGIAEIESVTGQLREADAHTDRLSTATSETADRLAARMKAVRKVQSDIEQMAWNTGLRCRNMGQDGLGLAVVATEIRTFAANLDSIWHEVSATFDNLVAAAGSIREGQERGGKIDAGRALSESLGSIRDGGARMRASLAGLDEGASTMIDILRDTTDNVDCEAEIGGALEQARDRLAIFSHPEADIPEDALAPLTEMLDRIARSYTMAREREVHRRFVLPTDGQNMMEGDPDMVADQDDDGLFDDGLFGDALLDADVSDDALFDDALF